MEYVRTVFYYETDQMGIVHHSNFIRWFEEARINYLAKLGCPYDEVEKAGIISPVLSVQCDYKNMVHFGDIVCINIRLSYFSQVKFGFEYVVEDAATGKIMATGSSMHCFLDKDGRTVHLKRDYPQIYNVMEKEVECHNDKDSDTESIN